MARKTSKFDRCVKSVRRTVKARKGSSKESAAIAICTKTVLHPRGRTLKRYRKGRLTTQRKFRGGEMDGLAAANKLRGAMSKEYTLRVQQLGDDDDVVVTKESLGLTAEEVSAATAYITGKIEEKRGSKGALGKLAAATKRALGADDGGQLMKFLSGLATPTGATLEDKTEFGTVYYTIEKYVPKDTSSPPSALPSSA